MSRIDFALSKWHKFHSLCYRALQIKLKQMRCFCSIYISSKIWLLFVPITQNFYFVHESIFSIIGQSDAMFLDLSLFSNPIICSLWSREAYIENFFFNPYFCAYYSRAVPFQEHHLIAQLQLLYSHGHNSTYPYLINPM